jgi:hypothetical protein
MPVSKVKNDAHRRDTRWNATYGTLLSGQAAIDGADATAIEMERRWGVGRLRLLVDTALREKFDRQDFLYNAAIAHGDLQEVITQSERMTKAWRALSQAAEATGKLPLQPEVWETYLADGTVAAIIPEPVFAGLIDREGRRMVVYTLDEIARILDHYGEITQTKAAFPGATVTAIRRQSVESPLDGIRDGRSLDDPIDDIVAFQ